MFSLTTTEQEVLFQAPPSFVCFLAPTAHFSSVIHALSLAWQSAPTPAGSFLDVDVLHLLFAKLSSGGHALCALILLPLPLSPSL